MQESMKGYLKNKMAKQTIKLSEREKTMLGMAKHIHIITPHNPVIGIFGKEGIPKQVVAYLPIVLHDGDWGKLEFNPQIKYDGRRKGEPTLKRCQKFMKECKNYLDGFVGREFILNKGDEEVSYHIPGRHRMEEAIDGYSNTIGLYTLAGEKIPNIIKKDFDINNLENILKKRLKPKDFHFSDTYLYEGNVENISDIKIKDLGECWNYHLVEEC